MIFKFRFKVLGGHTYVAVFCGRTDASLGKCGDLVFRNEEWPQFKDMVEHTMDDEARPVFVED